MKDFQILVFRILFCFLVCSPGSLSVLNAQIESTGYASMDTTEYEIEYPDTTLRDNIYIFCNEKGNLFASLDDVPGDLVFEWSVYDALIPGFDAPFRTDQGESSQISELESGGYQVRISDGNGLDTLLRAWVFVNNPGVNAKVVRHDCQVLDLDGIVDVDTFFYHHPQTNETDTLSPGFTFNWSASPSLDAGIPNRIDPRIYNPPSEETKYKLTINYHSCEVSDSISKDPVTTSAGFTITPGEGEAPLEVDFDAGESLNASEYKWYFDYQPGSPEGETPDGFTTDGQHTYYIPGEYNVLLRTISPSLCEDSLMYPETVRVYPSELEVPNVFSPDAENGDFLVRAVSMNDFHALIYNRNGRKVYESTDHSEGWDGKINGKLATPGVYFYVITGVGWDDVEYEFTGPLYLYRGR